MIPELNPKLIDEFRDKVNSKRGFVRHFFVNYKRSSSTEGKDVWSKICSCMDWLTVAVKGIEKPKLKKKMLLTSLEFTHFLVTIDMIIEAVNQLWLAIGQETKGKQPYINDRSIFQKREFNKDYTDEKYVKQIRSWFGVHAVNGNEVDLDGFDKGLRFFSSWSDPHDGQEFSLHLYSNNRKAHKEYGGTKKIKVDCLVKFAALRYETLRLLMEEIDKLYFKVIKELQRHPVHLDESLPELSQLRELYSQAQDRKLTSEYYEDHVLRYMSFLECDLSLFEEPERKVICSYLSELKPIIPVYKDIIQQVEFKEFEIFERLEMRSHIYADYSYEYAKILNYAEGTPQDIGNYGIDTISLDILIEEGLLPEYSTTLSGSSLSLLIHALDYDWNKTNRRVDLK
ncbi:MULTISPECIES: hypothetical protein [Bacillus]|uniref:Uncharacterized protein n=2 Tax=Bacillus TaxID=1386 RepID=A0A0M4FKJ9_9BACI|nr:MULTISPECIES: hypothetical protein [Bacillus]ALC83911.1 hypothetical protein AM592_22225 [Bacillus gobiensis]MBP1083026.1 hypothetical protein [Bacillus capparidis]MED1098001.1 hypothetical protein [Bacillus capparidis]